MAEELLIPKLAKAVEMEFGHILAVEANRKEQTMSNHVCGECRFHKYYALRNLDFLGITIEEWYCDNLDSRRSGQITQYNDTCERWAKEGADDE